MALIPGLGGLIDGFGDAVSGVIDMDPGELEVLKKTLHDNAELLEGGGFQDVSLAESAFGGSETAAQLGRQHQLAHTIVADTILGVIDDLRRYRQGVVDFERGMETADGSAAGDLGALRGAVEGGVDQGLDSLTAATSHSEGDRRNLDARAEHLPDDTSDATEGADS